MAQSSPSQLLAELEALASNPPKDLINDVELRAKLYNACGAARSALERPTEVVVRLILSQVKQVRFEPFDRADSGVAS